MINPSEFHATLSHTTRDMAANHTKPNLSQSQAAEIVKKHYKLTPLQLRCLPSYDDQNFFIATVEGGEYLLKILNSVYTKDPILIELQTYATNFLHENGLPTQTTLKTTMGQNMILEDIDCGSGLQKHLVRLLTYLPGIPISDVSFSSQLLYEVGQTAARMDNTLKEMEHPQLCVLQREGFIWSLSNIPLLEKYMKVLDGDPLLEVVKSVIQHYKTAVAPKYSSFRACLIHGDFNDLNVLVQANESNDYKISGIIDFGDMNFGCYVYELAITITYMMLEHPNPIDVGGPILAGWESVFPLNASERDCLFWLVLSRLCQSLVIARFSVTLQPENEEYLMLSSKKGIPILRKLFEIGKEQVEKVWFQGAAQFNDRK
ncbi:hydroxylysine kinase [Phycodurus eques]|uniref:hydroxylysine kinase n=1 Tax=Phycodurus eques TaxID=693459 RepID=UPI002ACE64E8|nr:hydroxylysine kinase [Phycodurus eques]